MDGLDKHELLQPAYITKVLDSIYPDPSQYALTQAVPLVTQPGDMVTVDVRHNVGGMTMAVAEGAESPIIAQRGRTQWSFQPAHFREKYLLGEKDIKAIRKIGTVSEMETAQQRVTEIVGDLRMRIETRMEWAKWQMIYGTLSINQADVLYTIDYKIPSEFKPTLTGGDAWDTATATPMEDLVDWLMLYRDEGTVPEFCQFNLAIEKIMLMNTDVRALRDSLFTGQPNLGNLTRENIKAVFNAYAGLPYQIYDKGWYYTVRLDSDIEHDSTTFQISENPGIVTNDVVTVVHKTGETRQKLILTTVSGTTCTIGAVGGSGVIYPAGSTIRIKKHFLGDDRFIIRGSVPPGTTGGTNWAEFVAINHVYGPGGLMAPTPGIFTKVIVKNEDDPPRIEVIGGVSGLPVLYHPTVNVVATVL